MKYTFSNVSYWHRAEPSLPPINSAFSSPASQHQYKAVRAPGFPDTRAEIQQRVAIITLSALKKAVTSSPS